VLTHGWPYTFAEMLPLLDELPEFDVIVPSLPGYGWSSLPSEGIVAGATVAETWHELMTSVLGYERFFTYGEDIGAGVSDWLAALHPESIRGIYAPHPAFTPANRRDGQTEVEAAFSVWLAEQWKGGEGYSDMQSNRPDTLAAGLSDSPAGLAAWIIEKFDEWSDGDHVFDLDRLLTTVMIYWVTNTIGPSFRPYFDHRSAPSLPVVTVPAAVIVQRHESEYPREMAQRNYSDLRFFSKLERGGHFTASEAPQAIAADIRAFVATLAE
jgi:pimeloyl-ACP methyl ester carboxylesterase